jgi:hypothetical protein
VIDCPVMLKSLARLTVMCVLVHASMPGYAQTGTGTIASRNDSHHDPNLNGGGTSTTRSGVSEQDADKSLHNSAIEGDSAKYPQPHIRFVDLPAMPSTWPLHERIAWAANLVLVLCGYAGIIIAVRVLAAIRRQTISIESIAQAAMDSANAALMNARVLVDAQRPWILMRVERSREIPNSFEISAMNQGATPAEIVDCPDRVSLVGGDMHLPIKIADAIEQRKVIEFPIMLLPGESSVLQRFGRGDVSWVCKTEESIVRVSMAEETIFVYGTVIYRGLNMPAGNETYKTHWCFRYVHGETTSDLVMGGPFEYNRHT